MPWTTDPSISVFSVIDLSTNVHSTIIPATISPITVPSTIIYPYTNSVSNQQFVNGKNMNKDLNSLQKHVQKPVKRPRQSVLLPVVNYFRKKRSTLDAKQGSEYASSSIIVLLKTVT